MIHNIALQLERAEFYNANTNAKLIDNDNTQRK